MTLEALLIQAEVIEAQAAALAAQARAFRAQVRQALQADKPSLAARGARPSDTPGEPPTADAVRHDAFTQGVCPHPEADRVPVLSLDAAPVTLCQACGHEVPA